MKSFLIILMIIVAVFICKGVVSAYYGKVDGHAAHYLYIDGSGDNYLSIDGVFVSSQSFMGPWGFGLGF